MNNYQAYLQFKKSTIGRLREALFNREITREEYLRHYLYYAVLLPTFVKPKTY